MIFECLQVHIGVPMGLNINQQTQTGYTALFYAAAYGHTEVVAALLQSPSIDINVRDNNGATALIRAIRDYRCALANL